MRVWGVPCRTEEEGFGVIRGHDGELIIEVGAAGQRRRAHPLSQHGRGRTLCIRADLTAAHAALCRRDVMLPIAPGVECIVQQSC